MHIIEWTIRDSSPNIMVMRRHKEQQHKATAAGNRVDDQMKDRLKLVARLIARAILSQTANHHIRRHSDQDTK